MKSLLIKFKEGHFVGAKWYFTDINKDLIWTTTKIHPNGRIDCKSSISPECKDSAPYLDIITFVN